MKIILDGHNGVLLDVSPRFELTTNIDEAERVVIWTDVTGELRSLAKLAKKEKKPVIVMQHGRKATGDYEYYKYIFDKIMVWSQTDVDRLRKFKIPAKKIVLTGTTIFSHLIPRVKHKKPTVLYSPGHHDVLIEENYTVADVLKEVRGVRMMTKTIETNYSHKFPNPIHSYRRDPKHLDICAKVLSEADVLVSVHDTTFELLAYCLDIPVIVPRVWKDRPMLGKPNVHTFSKACELVDLKDLKKAIKRTLKNPDKLKKERREIAIKEGGVDIKDPLKNIIKAIKHA